MGYLQQFLYTKRLIRNKNVRIGFLSRILQPSFFEGNNRVGKFSVFKGEMGAYSYMGDNSIILGKVGRYTSIADRVHVIYGRHPIKAPFVSTHPVFYSTLSVVGKTFVNKQFFDEYRYVSVVEDEHDKKEYSSIIGNDCWIGEGASIIGGLSIGDGAVVLANATVTKDVPPYAIVAGVPAQIIGYRYDKETIQSLLEIQWWNREESELKEKALLFSDLEQFLHIF